MARTKRRGKVARKSRVQTRRNNAMKPRVQTRRNNAVKKSVRRKRPRRSRGKMKGGGLSPTEATNINTYLYRIIEEGQPKPVSEIVSTIISNKLQTGTTSKGDEDNVRLKKNVTLTGEGRSTGPGSDGTYHLFRTFNPSGWTILSKNKGIFSIESDGIKEGSEIRFYLKDAGDKDETPIKTVIRAENISE